MPRGNAERVCGEQAASSKTAWDHNAEKSGVTLCAVRRGDKSMIVSKNGSQSNLVGHGLELCCILSDESWNVTGSD